MLLIPEIETVVILVPRTGSGSLRRALQAAYPKSMLIYRHMEADGIPAGYDRWRRVGVARHPVARLWSLYKFLWSFGGDQHDPAYVKAMNGSVDRPFSDWIVNNEVVFTSPYDRAGRGRYFPQFTCRHPMPENRKSQAMYLRPDLGTEIYDFAKIDDLAAEMCVTLGRENRTDIPEPPELDAAAVDHMCRFFEWDFEKGWTP